MRQAACAAARRATRAVWCTKCCLLAAAVRLANQQTALNGFKRQACQASIAQRAACTAHLTSMQSHSKPDVPANSPFSKAHLHWPIYRINRHVRLHIHSHRCQQQAAQPPRQAAGHSAAHADDGVHVWPIRAKRGNGQASLRAMG